MGGGYSYYGSGGGGSSHSGGYSFYGKGGGSKKKKGGGGFWSHGFGKIIGQGAADIYNTAVSAPAGAAAVVGSLAHDIREHPLDIYNPTLLWYHQLHDKKSTVKTVGKGMAEQVKQDVTHPLRHPGLTALDALAVLSLGAGSAARVGAAGRVLRAGEGAGAAGKALLHGPEPGSLVLRAGGVEKTIPASRSTIGRLAQSQINDLRNAYPNWHIGLRTQTQRVGRLVEKEGRRNIAAETAGANELAYKGRFIGRYSPRGLALRAVAEQTPIEMIQQTWRDAAASAKDARTRTRLEKRVAMAETAKKYVKVEGDRVSILPKYKSLAALENLAREVSLSNDLTLADEGLATAGQLTKGINAPGRIYRGAEYTPSEGLIGAENFTAEGGFHVGQPTRGKIKGGAVGGPIEGQVMNAGTRSRGALRNPLTGAAAKSGKARQDVPRIISENVHADARTIQRMRTGRFLYEHGQQTPVGLRKPQAIRDPALYGKETPASIREALDTGNVQQPGLAAMAESHLHDFLFPADAQNAQLLKYSEVGPVEGYRWIEKDLAPKPVVHGPVTAGGKLTMGFADAVNNASKFAILYLKPAYAVPNIVGNTFLTLTQQGVFAPKNIGRAVLLHKKLGARDTLLIDTLMGEGISGSLHGAGIGGRAVNLGARVFGAVVDLPFRRSSFIFEARKAGFKNASQIKKLLHDEAYKPKLDEITTRANRAMIEYGDLTPFEQSAIRRVLFFYPWLKGSVRYAKDYITDHPQQAALLGNLAQYGQAKTAAELGPLPSWAQGLFKVGGSEDMPLTVNPSAAGILSQPAVLAAVAAKMAGAPLHGSGYDLQQLLTPVLGAAVNTIAGENSFGGSAPRNLGTFGKSLYGGLPALTLYQRLTQDQSGRTYPMTQRQALLQFLLGGVAPRTTNRKKLNEGYRREQSEG